MGQVLYRGVGSIVAGPYDDSAGMIKLGNCEVAEFNFSEEEKTLRDYENSGGGTLASSSLIDKVQLKITMNNRAAANLEKLLRGTATAVAAGSATDEQHKGWHDADARIALDKHINPTSVVVKDVTGVTTYAVGGDYSIDDKGMIQVLSTGNIADGDALKISYSYDGHKNLEALTSASVPQKLVFVGLNQADGTPVIVKAHKVKFGPPDKLSLISDDFDKISVTATVEKDATITAAGKSQYWTVQQVEA